MKPETLKKLQEIGAFVLANGCNKKGLKQIAEMIRSARHYRWVAIYKVTSKEFVALTGQETSRWYPRFPLSQGICGAVLESGKTDRPGRRSERRTLSAGVSHNALGDDCSDDYRRRPDRRMLDAESAKTECI
jgi:hypothetical protein